MKVLLDECLPTKLARYITTHDTKTVTQMGWSGKKNGALLALAEKDFEVFITVDRNLAFQQNTKNLPIPVIVLQTHSNRLEEILLLLPFILKQMEGSLEKKVYVIK